MIRLIINDARIQNAGGVGYGGFRVYHSTSDTILAYCDSMEEAQLVVRELNQLAAQLLNDVK